MKKFLYLSIFVIALFSHVKPVFSQDCDVLVSQAITLVNSAKNALSDQNMSLVNTYLDAVQVLLQPCIDVNPDCPVQTILETIPQIQTATSPAVSGVLLDALSNLISLCNVQDVATSTTSQQRIEFVGITTFVNGVAITRDGRFVATNSSDFIIRIWDATTGIELYQLNAFQQRNLGMAVAFSPDSAYLATSDFSGNVVLWDYQTRTVIHRWQHDGYVWHVEFSPTMPMLASVGSDGLLNLYNIQTGRLIRRLRHDGSPLRGLAFSPNGRQVSASSEDNDVIIWDADTGEVLLVLSGHNIIVNDVVFSPDGNRVASIDSDGLLIIWDITTGAEITRISAHRYTAFALLWLPHTNRIVTGGDDGYLRIWDGDTYASIGEYPSGSLYVRAADYPTDEAAILFGTDDGKVVLFPTP